MQLELYDEARQPLRTEGGEVSCLQVHLSISHAPGYNDPDQSCRTERPLASQRSQISQRSVASHRSVSTHYSKDSSGLAAGTGGPKRMRNLTSEAHSDSSESDSSASTPSEGEIEAEVMTMSKPTNVGDSSSLHHTQADLEGMPLCGTLALPPKDKYQSGSGQSLILSGTQESLMEVRRQLEEVVGAAENDSGGLKGDVFTGRNFPYIPYHSRLGSGATLQGDSGGGRSSNDPEDEADKVDRIFSAYSEILFASRAVKETAKAAAERAQTAGTLGGPLYVKGLRKMGELQGVSMEARARSNTHVNPGYRRLEVAESVKQLQHEESVLQKSIDEIMHTRLSGACVGSKDGVGVSRQWQDDEVLDEASIAWMKKFIRQQCGGGGAATESLASSAKPIVLTHRLPMEEYRWTCVCVGAKLYFSLPSLSTLSISPPPLTTCLLRTRKHTRTRERSRAHTHSLFLSLSLSGGWTKAVSLVATASGDVSSVFTRRALAGIIRIGRPHLNGQSLREKPRLQLVQLSQTSQSAFCLKMGAAVDPSSRRSGRLCKGAKARHVLLPL